MESNSKVNILLVDDRAENLLALVAILQDLNENLVQAQSGEEALRCLLNQDFAVILLDVQMPGLSGFDTAALIRSRPRSKQTPIIFLTAFTTSEQLIFKGYSLGAVDYLQKPIDPTILRSKVAVFVDLFKKTEAIQQQTATLKAQASQLTAMNEELRQSEERFRLLSACSPVGIFFTDTEGHCTYTNPRFRAICGVEPEETLDEVWSRYIHPEDRDRIINDWSAYTFEGHEYSDEFRLQKSDGNLLWVRVRSTPMLSNQNELLGHVGTIEDITERKQVEAARSQVMLEQAARREAETANRMKDDFLAVLSHELRTPLNSMLGWARLLQSRKFNEETTLRALKTIERNATTQSQLIEDILDVSQIIRGKLRLNWTSVDLRAVIEAAIDSLRPQADAKSIEIKFTATPDSDRLWGDSVRLQQVIWNLLSNAIKFTHESGRIEVSLEWMNGINGSMNGDDSKRSSIHSHAKVTVTDTGIGIKPEFLPNVFDRFRQADSSITRTHNGLGLGLAIVRHIVELHGGTVQADSPGAEQGATFTIQLPLRQTKIQASNGKGGNDAAVHTPHTHTLKETKVLIVDDEADTRDFLSFALQQFGAITQIANSAAKALEAVRIFKPDVLISDIGMPEQDGYALIRQIRVLELQRGERIPAIALTAYTQESDRTQALTAGFQAHLSKPIDMNELIQTVTNLLNVQTVLSDDVVQKH